MKYIIILVIGCIVILGAGFSIPFIMKLGAEPKILSAVQEQDMLDQVNLHFDNPMQRLLTITYEVQDDAVVNGQPSGTVVGRTLFGIPVSRAQVSGEAITTL